VVCDFCFLAEREGGGSGLFAAAAAGELCRPASNTVTCM